MKHQQRQGPRGGFEVYGFLGNRKGLWLGEFGKPEVRGHFIVEDSSVAFKDMVGTRFWMEWLSPAHPNSVTVRL